MSKLNRILVPVLIAALVIVSVTWFTTGFLKDKSEYSTTGVMEKFNTISELNAIEMYFNEIIDYNNAKFFKELKLPFTEKSFMFKVEAKAKAGIDLTKIAEKDIRINDKSIAITLPRPTVTSKEILDYKFYYEKNGLFNQVTTEDTLTALDTFNDSLEKQALDSGIIEKAMENTKLYMENLLYSMGFESVQVSFASK